MMEEPIMKKRKVTYPIIKIPDQTVIKRRLMSNEEARLYAEAENNIMEALKGNYQFYVLLATYLK